MHEFVRNVDGRSIALRGINRTLFEFARETVLSEGSDLDHLALALAATSQPDRVAAATRVVERLWKDHPVLGPAPILDVLAEFEFDRLFYGDYRDHSCHVLKVYLLGLAFALKCKPLKDALETRLGDVNSDVFRSAWLATAVGHDIGYVLEAPAAEQTSDRAWKRVRDAINRRLHTPLATTPFFSALIHEDREKAIAQRYKIYRPEVTTASDLEKEGEESFFDQFQHAAEASGLGPTNSAQNAIERYYRFAKSKEVADGARPSFLDHGVTSGLIWLKLWCRFRSYLEDEVVPRCDAEPYFNRVRDKLDRVKGELADFENVASEIAGAMALHNIDRYLWSTTDLAAVDLTFDQYQIALYEDPERGVRALPLAFLLSLADVVQDWDRPRFRPTTESDPPGLDGENFDIQIFEHVIRLSYQRDHDRFRNLRDPSSRFSKTIRDLTAFLQPNAVSELLEPSPSVESTETDGPQPPNSRTAGELPGDLGRSGGTTDPLTFEGSKRVLVDHKWIVGAVNLDEDLHFSSFYLKKSLAANLVEQHQTFGYSCVVAVYRDFNETYYIKAKECRDVAVRLIQKVSRNPLWMQDILDEIHRRATDLYDVFPFRTVGTRMFREMTDYELLRLYRKHSEQHYALYEYARIPEALDRGYNLFTDDLRNYLRNRSAEFADERRLNRVFDALTAPEEPNPLGLEGEEFVRLLRQIAEEENDREAFTGAARRRYLRLSPSVIRSIEDYRDKWVYWGYHGYGRRALRDVDFYMDRFIAAFRGSDARQVHTAYLKEADELREQYFERYEIDDVHRMLFRLYGRIGAAKVHRRYVQLRNFYFFDQLIGEFAARHGVREGLLRSLRPAELEDLLEGNLRLSKSHEERMDFAVWVGSEDREAIFTADEGEALEQIVTASIEAPDDAHARELRGQPAFIGGRVRGRCRKVVRAGDSGALAFRSGEILVAESTDPDLIELMEKAGAVVTESGGVTSHASVICRERRIPSVVGISGLLEAVSDGEVVIVDTETGRLLKIGNESDWTAVVSDTQAVSATRLGGKAESLAVLVDNGLNVPAFFAVKLEKLAGIVPSTGSDDGVGPRAQRLWSEVGDALDLLGGDLFAIRSSMLDEDGKELSAAGRYETQLHVMRQDVAATILAAAHRADLSDTEGGSLVVQEMILGDVSGILLTSDPRMEGTKAFIEAIPGGNELLTEGDITPAAYRLERPTGICERVDDGELWPELVGDVLVGELNALATQLEDLFGAPQEVEWTAKDGRLYLLQSRPITEGADPFAEPESALRPPRRHRRSILEIYRSYRVPAGLQYHMLQVAAVGQWILDHWKGPVLDRDRLIVALLLHDVGNLVKADYRRFPRLFPAELANLGYWSAMQEWIMRRYGDTDLKATKAICAELGVEEDVLRLIEAKQFVNNVETKGSGELSAKVAAYADQRVSPRGILPIRDRLLEAVKRYRDLPAASVNHPDRDALIQAALEIELQVFEFVNGKPEEITNRAIETYVEDLKTFAIPVGRTAGTPSCGVLEGAKRT